MTNKPLLSRHAPGSSVKQINYSVATEEWGEASSSNKNDHCPI